LCYFELKKILREQYIKTHKHKRNKKKTYNMILTESTNDISNTNKQITSLDINLSNDSNNYDNSNLSKNETNLLKDETNLLKDETNLLKDETNLSKEETNLQDDIESGKYMIEKKNFKNDIYHIDKIGLDYDNKILNIIEFMSVEEELKNSFKLDNINYDSFSKCYDEIENQSKENQLKENKQQELSFNSLNNNKFNLLNEIDLLKTNNQHSNINPNINPDINEDNISNYICDNINENDNDNINETDNKNVNYSNDNNINEYLFVDNNLNVKNTDKSFMLINDEQNELINLEDIDFGSNLDNIVNIKTNKSETIQVIEKKIIKIGKKKKN
jgi:hypothetical protein